jgi:regulator of cell morphogenesis and NO signaling
MSTIAGTPLQQLVLDNPRFAATLDQFGLDFCCHGSQSLAQACERAGVALQEVEQALAEVKGARGEHWSGGAPGDLISHIEAVHHAYLYRELPDLVALATKVRGVHGDAHPELATVEEIVRGLQDDLVPHMRKEDLVLFPAIRALEEGPSTFGFGTIANPIAVMTAEHETVGTALKQLRAATGGYTVPDDACTSYRVLYQRLADLETDTHIHVLEENSVLFPAARELEAGYLSAGV